MSIVNFPTSRLDQNVRAYAPGGKKSFATAAAAKFWFWHVETLLNRASDLLDRCLSEQARWDSLRAQEAVLQQAMTAEDQLLSVEEKKIEIGAFDYPLQDAIAKEKMLAAIFDFMGGDRQHGALQHIQQAGNEANETNHDQYAYQIQQAAADQWRATTERYLHEREEASAAVTRARGTEDAPDVKGRPGSVELAKLGIKQARERLNTKKKATENGGPLDFAWQANRCAERANRDFEDASERLLVASDGMLKIYGYEQSLNPVLDLVERGDAPGIDASVSWAREAIKWLAAFSQNDQTFTVAISLREALGDLWKEAIANPNADFPFRINSHLFSTHHYVRLRGLSASLMFAPTATEIFPVRCVLGVPAQAIFIVPKAIAGESEERQISQNEMPRCVLGHVLDYRVPLEPEVCGAISLMNASPIASGDSNGWSVEISTIEKAKLALLDDIVLQIKVSGQPVAGKKTPAVGR